jgi:hypothetical protein
MTFQFNQAQFGAVEIKGFSQVGYPHHRMQIFHRRAPVIKYCNSLTALPVSFIHCLNQWWYQLKSG